jgi:cytochrome c553
MHSIIITIIGLFCINLYAQEELSIPQIVESQCMNCHGDPTLELAPMISGQKKDFLEFELFNFKNEDRDHEIMNQIMEQFSEEDVKEVAKYISNLSLCDSQAPVVENPTADIKNGAKIYAQSCINCHKKDISGIAPIIHGQKSYYLETAIKSFQSSWYAPRPSRVNMKFFTDMLSDQDIKDVAAYLNKQSLCK